MVTHGLLDLLHSGTVDTDMSARLSNSSYQEIKVVTFKSHRPRRRRLKSKAIHRYLVNLHLFSFRGLNLRHQVP